MTYNSLLQPFEILLWLLVAFMEKSMGKQIARQTEIFKIQSELLFTQMIT